MNFDEISNLNLEASLEPELQKGFVRNGERRFGGRAPWRPLFLKNSNSNFYGSKNSEKNIRVCKDVTHMCVKIHDEIP